MLEQFKSLKQGIKRAIIAGTIPGAMLIGGVLGSVNERNLSGDDFMSYSVFIGIPIYWAIVFIGLWVYQGFKENK